MKIFSIIKQVGIINFLKAGAGEVYRKIIREILYGSYAQDWEDVKIGNVLDKSDGFYVEIGAYHPTRLSNTYRFYKKGWRGIVVEPNPGVRHLFERLRPKDKLVTSGIGPTNGHIEYYQYDIPALNTFSKKQAGENKKDGYKVIKIDKIEVMAIKDFLNKYLGNRKIDLLSLDVEGWDEIILKNWDWKFKPQVICVEKSGIQIGGYVMIYKTRFNSILARKD